MITDLGEISVTALSWDPGLVLSVRTSWESPFGAATDLQQNHWAGTVDRTDSGTEGTEAIISCRRLICDTKIGRIYGT